MAWQLRTLNALSDDPNSAPSVHVGGLIGTYNSSSNTSDLHEDLFLCARYPHIDTHTYMSLKIIKMDYFKNR